MCAISRSSLENKNYLTLKNKHATIKILRATFCRRAKGQALNFWQQAKLQNCLFFIFSTKICDIIRKEHAAIAQLVERIHGKDEVTGSNPVRGSSMCSPQAHEPKVHELFVTLNHYIVYTLRINITIFVTQLSVYPSSTQ